MVRSHVFKTKSKLTATAWIHQSESGRRRPKWPSIPGILKLALWVLSWRASLLAKAARKISIVSFTWISMCWLCIQKDSSISKMRTIKCVDFVRSIVCPASHQSVGCIPTHIKKLLDIFYGSMQTFFDPIKKYFWRQADKRQESVCAANRLVSSS